ncbi:glycosyltransferase family 90 protein [Hortaea werneckii]|nr:glycosyltransferase family 90 protein [Hortaea werneckii]
MDRTKWPAISGLTIGTYLLCRSVPGTFAFDKPLHTSVTVLATCAATLLLLGRILPREIGASQKDQQYDAVPLEDVGIDHSPREPSPSREDVRYPSSLRKLRILFLILVIAICARVATLKEIVENPQCAALTWEPLIPLALAIGDYWTVQRRSKRMHAEDYENNLYDDIQGAFVSSPYRYLLTAGVLSLSSLLALAKARSVGSTYICAATLPHTWMVPASQHFGTFLDLVIMYCVGQLLHQYEVRGQRSVALRFVSIGWAALFSAAAMLGVLGTSYLLAGPPDRRRLIGMSSSYVWSLFRFDLLASFTATCTLFTVGLLRAKKGTLLLTLGLQIYHVGIMSASMIAAFVSTTTIVTSFTWNNAHPFPPTSTGLGLLAIILAIISFTVYFHVDASDRSHASKTLRSVPAWLSLILATILIVHTSLWASHSSTVSYHPIDLLIYDAARHHEAYLNQSSSSTNLEEAVANYEVRYNRPPPPAFNHWYKYATARNSVVIDDFDSIHRDLLPFWAVPPEIIRERTYQLISNPWHDVAGVSIRGGKADVSPNVMPTHRWMVDGLVEMIGHFAEYLPDMDLAFNLNDECRVAVPFEDIEPMRKDSAHPRIVEGEAVQNRFSEGRAEQWKTVPEEPSQERVLKEMSWQKTFYEFGSIGCPPKSPARKDRTWNTGELCTTCTNPHSLGAFLANWTLAGNICHQPDLANLHGLYLSPAAFKASHELYPIFSQSKTHGFNDILYPSAWNYLDKARYEPSETYPDPEWREKNNTLFWRGATSEGVSQGFGSWMGMARQRFVHMTRHHPRDLNTSSSSSSSTPPQPLLLPNPNQRPRSSPSTKHPEAEGIVHSPLLHYQLLPSSHLPSLLLTDLQIVETIARCGGRDCSDQAAEFSPLASPSDFQYHWQYRFLLDLDGAGFSGRFLPFLFSKSLPFKAGVFREWWDDRVTAWLHFVPVDVRGQGLWGTLGYFAGVRGSLGSDDSVGEEEEEEVDGPGPGRGKRGGLWIDVPPHEVEGEEIAERGRRWAGQVLRKEDMEIYFFRLLLEWGRLTDDARDGIGFSS